MYQRKPAPDHDTPGAGAPPKTAATTGPAPSSADLIQGRQLEKSVSWSGRERLRCPRGRTARAARLGRRARAGRRVVATDAGANLLLMVVVTASSCGVARAAGQFITSMCSGTAIPDGRALRLFRAPHGRTGRSSLSGFSGDGSGGQ
jgi:hypothetical protein